MNSPLPFATRALALERRLRRWPRLVFVAAATVLVLSLVMFFFSPRWNILREHDEKSYEWNRGVSYLKQCEDPLHFHEDVDDAMRWRLLPPIVAHTLGLRGLQALAVPWLGLVALVACCVFWGENWLRSRLSAFAFALLIGTTSAVLVPMHWVGVNDAWVWLALLSVPLCRSRTAGCVAGLLAPWVDERFVIGLPLAVWARVRARDGRGWFSEMVRFGLFLVPYAAIRLTMTVGSGDHVTARLFHETVLALRAFLPYAPLGWWMGLRAAGWFGVVSIGTARREGLLVPELAIVGVTLAVSTFVAHDLSRSIPILLPWIFVGILRIQSSTPEAPSPPLMVTAGANLLIPAAHVLYTFVILIKPLPVEIVRLFY